MCGIFGEIGTELTSKKSFDEMLYLSKKRGPDMDGYYRDEDIQFGFNRLSIIDVSINGNQPLKSPSGRYVIICNGEIVNFKSIQQKLSIKNNMLRSNSDIEILSHALEIWGISKLHKEIRGMFSLAIFDRLEKKLSLSRDPAGIKPLYYAKTRFGVIFASQYDQIFKHDWFKNKKSINITALSEYFKLGYIPSPLALFENSYLLGPGEICIIDNNYNTKISSFYNYDDLSSLDETKLSTIHKVENSIESYISEYLQSDAPIASFLSGGVDSSLLNSLISKKIKNFKAFTISEKHNGINESTYAKQIADHLEIGHHIEDFSDKSLNKWIDNHFKSFSEPFADFSSLPSFKICEIASSSYKVMIAGDGGDELFWGYTRFLKTVDHKNWFKYHPFIRRIISGILRKTGKKISSGIECNDLETWIFEMMGPFNSDRLKYLLPDFKYSKSTRDLYKIPSENISAIDLLKWQKKTEFLGHMQRRLLKVDRTSMWHGIEVRVPYLDQRLLDLSLKIKPSLGIEHREPKYLLKEILYEHVPKNKLFQGKQGFSIDLAKILRNDLKEEVQDLLHSKNTSLSSILNQKFIQRSVEDYMNNENNNSWEIWALYAFEKFRISHDLF